MSTRANIIIKDQYGSLIFYRHSDGYPESCVRTLKMFLDNVKTGKIRDNVEQAAGWLIILGHLEAHGNQQVTSSGSRWNLDSFQVHDWKVGCIEPAEDIHGDIEFLYEINLQIKTIECWKHNGDVKQEKVDITEYLK